MDWRLVMSRSLALAAALSALSGCIIYEGDFLPPCDGRPICDDGSTTTTPDDTGAPQVTENVRLTPNEAAPGDELLAFLVPAVDGVDMGTVASLSFERDVLVLDIERRADEIVLLLSVSEVAEPGDVEVFLTTENGGGFILAEPFHILGDAGTTTTATTTGTGTATGTGTTTP